MQARQQQSTSPFHEGEQAVQSRLGVRDTIEPWARQVVRPFLPQQQRDFYTQLPFVVAAARDNDNRPWVTLLVGSPGFVQAPDSSGLRLSTQVLPGDALEGSLVAGADLGLLGIELDTRRRNRVNGTITETGASGLRFEVGQAFGNCPQYITERTWQQVEVVPGAASATRHRRLDAQMQEWIGSADTMFIASGYHGNDRRSAAYGMDASHRGGAAGFVKVLSDTRIVFPDYAGNNHFNTIGNLVLDPSVGLLFVDFEAGSLLQISGQATIDWDSEEIGKHPGAQRLVVIDVEQVVQLDGVLPLRWSAPEGSIRSLRVVDRVRESRDVVSFVLGARDDGDLPDFEAGQHLPIELQIEGHDKPVKRTYSLSNGPGEGYYRISVKREPHGLVSQHLHDQVQVGDIISSTKPDGEFTMQHVGRPVVLISAGIGVTPMVSMLHALTAESGDRHVRFIHGVRDGDHHPLADEVWAIALGNDNVELEFIYSRPHDEDTEGWHYHRQGHVSGAIVEELVPGLDADFYLCGPTGFLADISASLGERGVSPERIHVETF